MYIYAIRLCTYFEVSRKCLVAVVSLRCQGGVTSLRSDINKTRWNVSDTTSPQPLRTRVKGRKDTSKGVEYMWKARKLGGGGRWRKVLAARC